MKKLTNNTVEALYTIGFVGASILVVVLTLWWTSYRNGGVNYYMKVNQSVGEYAVAVPINLTKKGYIYCGTAKNADGVKRVFKFKTDAHDLGPFSKGQMVRLVYNNRYGITHYERVSIEQVPPKARH